MPDLAIKLAIEPPPTFPFLESQCQRALLSVNFHHAREAIPPARQSLTGGVGAVYRRAFLPCQMRNERKFCFFVSSFASSRPVQTQTFTAASIWRQAKRLQGRERLIFQAARGSGDISLAAPGQDKSGASLATKGALERSVKEARSSRGAKTPPTAWVGTHAPASTDAVGAGGVPFHGRNRTCAP